VAVAVFGQLDYLLRQRNLTVGDLKHQIEERDGSVVDDAVLDHLISGQRLPQTDLTTVGTVASILGVPLDDLLLVVRIPFFRMSPTLNLLNEEETWRLWTLLALQERRELTDDEQRELESIVDESGRRSDEYFWHKEAQRRGVTFEDLQSEREADERVVKATKHGDEPHAVLHRPEPVERAEEPRTPASR